jgi:GNAT superfamily N-acetyltransferase
MARTTHAGVELRTATADDVDALIAVFADLEGAQSNLLRRGRNIASARDGDATREGFLAAIADPHRRVILALHDGVAAGFALLAVVPSSSLVHEPSVRIDPLVVSRGARRRGVGRLLMGAAAAYAEEHGATTLTVAVRPGDRDGNRHFSRLGFAPVEVRRVAPVAAVRRAIAMPRGDVVVPLAPALRRRHTRELRRERAL